MTASAEEMARLAAVGTSGVSDAMERLGLPRSVLTGFCRIAPGTVAGRALTVRQVPKRQTAARDARLVRHGEIGTSLAQPGDFVVVDAGGRRDIAAWGHNHAARCQARGVAGILVNGAVRDTADLGRLGLPVFHLGSSPVASRWDQETAEIGGTVVVAGVQIRQGDVILGDEDGLIVLVPEQLASVIGELR